ncbi:acyl-CoA desaturase [Janibacter cremeus]|uniref:fatty acid desaturase family protein n=1 Tax=Janibacter cremeus TaxID=1285192 RepID=UPI0023F8BE53|nr:acyl-CoA desaturase [Janibacter cremeus]WEV78192.1 acyl-CoA desaturase [Janibacter cremeus]WEV78272.1 acyl-CoA desaturase [Janibacter cremeus]
MTATLERTTARTTDARITGGSSEVIHTDVTMTPSPIAHLTPQQIEQLGRELDEIRTETMDSLGEKDARYIRRVIAAQRYLEIGGRAALFFSGNPVAWVAGTAALSASKILDNMEVGHNIIHGQWDWMRDPRIHSSTWEWDNVTPADHWKNSHNKVHHTYTNVVGHDNDLGYGIMRVDDAQKWYPGYLIQPVTQFINATFFEYGIAAYDLELGKHWATRHDNPEWMAEAKKVVNKIKKQAGKDYLLFPLLAGPNALSTLGANVVANLVRNYWTHSVIMCGHFPAGVKTFAKNSIDGETRGEWYLRQMLGSANITGSTAMHIATGHLSYQIEHHLFPDMPSRRYPEIAPKIEALFDKYGLEYVTGPLHKQVGSAWSEILRLSLPNDTSLGQTIQILRTKGMKGLKARARATRHIYAR